MQSWNVPDNGGGVLKSKSSSDEIFLKFIKYDWRISVDHLDPLVGGGKLRRVFFVGEAVVPLKKIKRSTKHRIYEKHTTFCSLLQYIQ